ncbi:hypothetical protein D3C85_1316050 [compost metagenome]
MRQRAAVIGTQNRQHRHPLTDLQLGFSHFHFSGDREATKVIGWTTIAIERQQLRAASALTTIKLDRIEPQYIDTEPGHALSESGFGVENETLGPLLRLALRVSRIGEIAIDVEVTQVQVDAGLIDKTGRRGPQG